MTPARGHGAYDLRGLALALASGATDPVALVEAALAAVGATSTFITLASEMAFQEAEAARRRRLEGRPRSAFDGIPVGIKDMIDVAGLPTTLGSRLNADAPLAQTDAQVVVGLRAAGFVMLGKTNLSEFAFSGLGLNPHFGTPLADRPGPARVPGGSSSGSAVAVQRRIVPACVGTDTAGSIRVPAAFNGLVGFKASQGRYGMTGVRPLAPSFDSLGPIAHCVTDCILMDAAMRGACPTVIQPRPLQDQHFVVDTSSLYSSALAPSIRAALIAFAVTLEGEGARVEFRQVAPVVAVRDAIGSLGWPGGFEAWELHREEVTGPDGDRIDPHILTRLRHASRMTPAAFRSLLGLRQQLRADIRLDLAGGTLVLPTVMQAAPLLTNVEHDLESFAEANRQALAITMVASFLDMPGLALPVGEDAAALPLSLLLNQPSGCDDELLAVGLAAEALLNQREFT